jgi:hypothetical protein
MTGKHGRSNQGVVSFDREVVQKAEDEEEESFPP